MGEMKGDGRGSQRWGDVGDSEQVHRAEVSGGGRGLGSAVLEGSGSEGSSVKGRLIHEVHETMSIDHAV